MHYGITSAVNIFQSIFCFCAEKRNALRNQSYVESMKETNISTDMPSMVRNKL